MTQPLLTVVMYHYVRPLECSRFPAIKGLDLPLFREQVQWLCRHYRPVALAEVVAAAAAEVELPQRPVLLTFDDGYADHYQYVLPILSEYRISGAFYPPTAAVFDRRVLDVNKIHFLLASVAPAQILEEMERRVEASPGLPPAEVYRGRHMSASRLDTPEVAYLKRMLQFGLPESVRTPIISDLFARFVSHDEAAFAEELYVTVEQLKLMRSLGMEIGSHGDRHSRLDSLTREEQAEDIDRSFRLFDALGLPRTGFSFCYPYGAYNTETLDLLRQRGCAGAVTTRVELARLDTGSLLEVPRLDTNCLPTDRLAAVPAWTRCADTGDLRP